MKLFSNVLVVLSIIALLSTLTCGVWIRNQKSVNMSDLSFHMWFGIGTVILTIATLVTLLLYKK